MTELRKRRFVTPAGWQLFKTREDTFYRAPAGRQPTIDQSVLGVGFHLLNMANYHISMGYPYEGRPLPNPTRLRYATLLLDGAESMLNLSRRSGARGVDQDTLEGEIKYLRQFV